MLQASRRTFLASSAAAAFAAPSAKQPNILYILADDLGWGDLGCYNRESQIPTPHMDRLASQGMRFTDMHSPSSVCTPTRYGILTGRYCWRGKLKKGVLWGYSPNLIEPGRPTVASMLKAQGYTTAGIGKWHLGLGTSPRVDYDQPFKPGPVDHGFDSYFGIPASLDMDPYVYIQNDRVIERPTGTTPGQNSPRGVFWRPGPIAPGLQIDQVLPTLQKRALNFVAGRRGARNPFFLYLPLTGPHTPWVANAPWRGKSKAGDYGDFVMQVDDVIGTILKALDDAKLTDNTLVVATSDNGAHWTPEDKQKYPHRANASWRGMKADVWDAGHRIPFLVRWPGQVKPGTVSKALGCLTDLAATVADIQGVSIPSGAAEDSFSLLPALKGKQGTRDHVIHHSSEGMFAIRDKRWKLAMGLGSGGFSKPVREEPLPGQPGGQLFDLERDPSESNNVYAQHPEIVARLSAKLLKCRQNGRTRP